MKQKLSKNTVELFNDGNTRILSKNYSPLSLNEELERRLTINSEYFSEGLITTLTNGPEAFYFEIEISGRYVGEEYQEDQRILYFIHENIDFFQKIILDDFFDVLYLCVSSETGTKMPIINSIYGDLNTHYYADRGFKPRFTILTAYRCEFFQNAINNTNLMEIESR